MAIQALVVYTGYLIPPESMRPWFKWIIWINPVQYTFESIMSNEFYRLTLPCVDGTVVPQGPNASSQHQSCLIRGSEPDQTYVRGASYIMSNYTYTRHHLWRNFGIVIGWFLLYIGITVVGMEWQKPSYGGRSVTLFKKGQVPKEAQEEMKSNRPPDEESGEKIRPNQETQEQDGVIEGIAKNSSIFTWQHVNYHIPAGGKQKQLLCDVQGYVRPGRLTALMGASGSGKTTLLNALAQRLDFGVVTGEFLVDGQ